MEKHQRCPNCGRSLTKNEVYCYFCELNLDDLKKKDKGKIANNKIGNR